MSDITTERGQTENPVVFIKPDIFKFAKNKQYQSSNSLFLKIS